MNSLLAITAEVLKDGLLTFILGVFVVFFGIAVIVFFVWLFGYLFNKFTNRVKKPKKADKNAQTTPTQDVVEDGSIPEHVKVAIITAVTAYYFEQNNKKCDFTVRKIKKLN